MHANELDMRRLIYSQVISSNKHKACACFSIKTSQTAELKSSRSSLPFSQQNNPEAHKACKAPGEHDSTALLHEW